jgi:hypothetical protein
MSLISINRQAELLVCAPASTALQAEALRAEFPMIGTFVAPHRPESLALRQLVRGPPRVTRRRFTTLPKINLIKPICPRVPITTKSVSVSSFAALATVS